jgi:deoxyinosine 3'endonuclease (endonuclease V)
MNTVQDWEKFQTNLASKRICSDNFTFNSDFNDLKYVAGCDVSFFKTTDFAQGSLGFATIVILEYPSLKMVHSKSSPFKTDIPYKSGYLSFREYPIILELLNELKIENKFYPQILLVDGCGLFHPRKCGLACTIGILANLPTIGISKNFLVIHEQDLNMDWMKSNTKSLDIGESVNLCGKNKFIYGTATRTSIAHKPIFISPGNMISVETATKLVLKMCKFRIPEPIRMADQLSRKLCAIP